ncbi:MAG: glycosyltransferase [Clostridiales bacterium]|nr:glycosyltransferase [Clostridiales bacterium]
MKFSACWIVKNEEENIEKSILSVKDCAEELIVVDTGSTDGTVRAAEQCGAMVARFDWVSDFSAARNYALSLASGEFVLFLDGDEYFYPSLTAADGERFAEIFEETEADVLDLHSIEIEKESGFVHGVRIRKRLLRRAVVHYEGRVHETPVLADGRDPKASLLENYKMIHTGASRSVVPQKIKRNLAIIEEEQKSIDDPLSRYLNAIYQMRESFFLGDIYKAADYLMYLLAHHEHHGDAYSAFPAEYRKYYYTAIHVVEMKRVGFSRKEVYEKLFKVIKERCAGSRDGMLADLHYQLRFDYRDDRFLRELAEVEPKLPADMSMELPDCRLIEARIFAQAAEAAHMRGDRKRTCRYAYRALACTPVLEDRPLLLLLYSLKGCPLKEAESVLKSAALPSRPDIAAEVITVLNAEDACERRFDNARPPEVFPPEIRHAPITGEEEPERTRISLFRSEAEKRFARMRYGDILRDSDASFMAAKDFICAYYVAYAYLMREDYVKAHGIVAPHIKSGMANQELLSILSVVAEKAREPLAAEAGELYEGAMAARFLDFL